MVSALFLPGERNFKVLTTKIIHLFDAGFVGADKLLCGRLADCQILALRVMSSNISWTG